jgi:integral membrane protein (TIGR01906 family)
MAQRSSKGFSKGLSTAELILVILTPVVAAMFFFSIFVFNTDFYESHLAGDAMPATINLLDYFQGRGDIRTDIGFSDDELSHLSDVKALINGVLSFLQAVILIFLFLSLFLQDYKRYLRCSGILLIIIPVIAYILPFDKSFTLFHNIFFPQGNWMFPSGSALISLYPAGFFYSFASMIFLCVFVTGWGLIILSFFVDKTKKFK